MVDGRTDEASEAKLRKAGEQGVALALEASRQAEEARGDDTGEPRAHAASANSTMSASTEKPGLRSDVPPRRWPGMVSIAALVFSGISLYETVLKQAELSDYVGDVGHLGRDRVTNAEIIALPVTVTNRGARDAIVISLRLGTDDEPDRYRSSFVGGSFAGINEAFAPWPIQGHGSHSGIVQFHAKGDAAPLIVPAVNGAPKSYELCLIARAEASRPFSLPVWSLEHLPAALRFVVEPAYRFNEADMKNGNWIPLWITGIKSIDYQDAMQVGRCRTPR